MPPWANGQSKKKRFYPERSQSLLFLIHVRTQKVFDVDECVDRRGRLRQSSIKSDACASVNKTTTSQYALLNQGHRNCARIEDEISMARIKTEPRALTERRLS